MGEAAMFNGPFWFGKEGRVTIIVSNNDYLLLDYESKKITNLGNKLIEAKERLTGMGKDENFSDFMNE